MLLPLVRLKLTPTPLIIPNPWTTLPPLKSLTTLTLRNSPRPKPSLSKLPPNRLLRTLKLLSKPLSRRTKLLKLAQWVLPLSPHLIKKN